jgi:phytoene desaturase
VVRQTVGPQDFAEQYNSWSGGMLGPAHVLRQSAMFRAPNQSRKVAGLYYAGATTAPGVGVPMCLISAELVSKRIKADHSAGPTSPQPRSTR